VNITKRKRMQTWSTALTVWRTELQAIGVATGTIRLREHYVSRFGRDTRTTPPFVTRDDILAWLADHTHWATETRKSARDALVAFFAWYEAAGCVLDSPAADLAPISVPTPDPRPANQADVAAALRSTPPRVWLMLMLGAVEGMRRAEIAVAHTRDLRGNTMQVHGKGKRRRQLQAPDVIAKAIREVGEGYLFPNPLTGQPMTPGHVGRLMSRALPDGTTPHQLRHLAASDLKRRDVPVEEIQLFLGHSSITTTMRYTAVTPDHVPDASSAAAAALLAPLAQAVPASYSLAGATLPPQSGTRKLPQNERSET
jgi:integrase/recombinase XerC